MGRRNSDMPFYRFEAYENRSMTPRLSTGRGPIIEGAYIYFCKVFKAPGEGSVLHYHPNELLIFPLEGKINALVGKDRRIVSPGTFVHVPPYGQHLMKATEDGPMSYLYIKDKTWTVVGVGADEALPDQAPTLSEVNEEYEKADWSAGAGETRKDSGESSARIDGLGDCYYPIIDSLDAPPASSNRTYWIEGERMIFGFTEVASAQGQALQESEHEQFSYVLNGTFDAQVDDDRKTVGPGDIIHVPIGSCYCLSVSGSSFVRYVTARSKTTLESSVSGSSGL
jgi:quercetin dioxygenase-like cupin family protein